MTRRWYLLCLVPIVLCGAAAGIVFYKLAREIDAMQRVTMPGASTLQLPPGDYVAYVEADLDAEGHEPDRRDPRCALSADGGAVVGLRPPVGRTTYQLGDRGGHAVYNFTILRAGPYRFECAGDTAGPFTLTIGHGIGASIATILAIMFAGLGAAAILFLMIRRRRRAWKAAQPAAPPATTGS